VITIPERHTQTDRQTDRQTDGQTTYDSNTALCTKVHRAVIIISKNTCVTALAIPSDGV